MDKSPNYCCADCRFSEGLRAGQLYECRVNPPRIKSPTEPDAIWPIVQGSYWCGKFKGVVRTW